MLFKIQKCYYIDVSAIVYHAPNRLFCLGTAEIEVVVYYISD